MHIRPQYLQLTSSLLLVTFAFFLFNSKKNICEIVLASLLLLTFILSQLFWSNPIRYSKIHKLDAIIAKFTLISFILYVFLFKQLSFLHFNLFLLLLCFMFYFFYYSHCHSCKEWCSNFHLYYHGLAHICCCITALYAFI
jgi:Ca2+/Na+ antiporter